MSKPGSWDLTQSFLDYVKVYGYVHLSLETQLDLYFSKFPNWKEYRPLIEVMLKRGELQSDNTIH